MRSKKPIQMTRAGITIIILVLLVGCEANYTPKPKGYYKIDLPERNYITYNSQDCPFTFEMPDYALVIKDTIYDASIEEGPCWLNIGFPALNRQVHLSYKDLRYVRLTDVLEDMHKLTSKHIPRANSITETPIRTDRNVNGLLYEVGGEAASAIQFYLTDSTQHFIRGDLYFYSPPNADSIAPVVEFVREDILHIINTWQWKEQ
jgi:gliding motility-associated lipoprotein GldD